MSKRIALCMIVKNEAHIIEQTLNSALPFIDSYCIVDTGSTDDTKKIIAQFFKSKGVPGALHSRPWVNFGHNRTEALELCKQVAKYAFVMDADDLIEGKLVLPTKLVAPVYMLLIGPGTTYWRNQIIRLDKQWRYVGALHEVLMSDRVKNHEHVKITGDYMILSRRLGDRSKDAKKFEKDAAVLLKVVLEREARLRKQLARLGITDVQDDDLRKSWPMYRSLYGPKVTEKDELYERSCFYLGQSYFDAKMFTEAKYWYGVRASMEGWYEEVYYSNYKILSAMITLGETDENKLATQFFYILKRWPNRAEPMEMMGRFAMGKKDLKKAYFYLSKAVLLPYPSQCILFVDNNCYQYATKMLFVDCCMKMGNWSEAAVWNDWLLINSKDDLENNFVLGLVNNRSILLSWLNGKNVADLTLDQKNDIVDLMMTKEKHNRDTLDFCKKIELLYRGMDEEAFKWYIQGLYYQTICDDSHMAYECLEKAWTSRESLRKLNLERAQQVYAFALLDLLASTALITFIDPKSNDKPSASSSRVLDLYEQLMQLYSIYKQDSTYATGQFIERNDWKQPTLSLYGPMLLSSLPRIWTSWNHFLPKLKKETGTYNVDMVVKVNPLLRGAKKTGVIFTMTTCKRLDLFMQTMTSFVNCCQDIEMIDEFIIIDDNSTPEDRAKMAKAFPFCRFILKTPEQKGHPLSMDMLRHYVCLQKYTYWMHMEDDFHFFKKRSLVADAITIMSQHPEIGQVLFNRHYLESSRITHDFGVGQGFVEKEKGVEFIRHLHIGTEEAMKAYVSSMPVVAFNGGSSHSYWEGFSFRPSVLRVDMMEELGPFHLGQGHFERIHAVKAKSLGWQSVFFNDFCCEHIGRLTSERHTKDVPNAYVLNEQSQF